MVVLEIAITNQNDQRLVAGEATVKVLPLENKERAVEASGAKTVLITGGSGGIGAATARQLAKAGHTVVVNYRRNADAAGRLVAEIVADAGHAIALGADVAQAADVTALFAEAAQRVGAIQAVVHCAALPSALLPLGDLTWATIQQQLEVQVQGAFHCVQAALPGMLQAQAGAFVFVGSVAADGVPPLHQTDYVIAKAALSALARSLAAEYGPKGIRANLVAPGMTQTEMIAGLPEKAKMLTRMQTPLRRLAESADVAEVIAFLLSPAARHVTGETLRVCGGSVML
jgi:3-oxoacyl-[acyl-carrier protein] reductase